MVQIALAKLEVIVNNIRNLRDRHCDKESPGRKPKTLN